MVALFGKCNQGNLCNFSISCKWEIVQMKQLSPSLIVCFTAGVSFARIAEREMLCFNCLLISNNGFYKSTALLKAASVF